MSSTQGQQEDGFWDTDEEPRKEDKPDSLEAEETKPEYKFLENEASDSSNVEEEENTKRDKVAGENSSEEEDSSEDDAEELNEYEKDDFLVEDGEEEEEEGNLETEDSSYKEHAPKEELSPKKRRERLELAEGDYELLEEAGVRVSRGGRRLKRLRKAGGELPVGSEEPELEDTEDRKRAKYLEDDEEEISDEEDDLDDFLEDKSGRLKRRRSRNSALPEGVSERAVRLAREIFGDDEEEYKISSSLFMAPEGLEEEEEEEDRDAAATEAETSKERETKSKLTEEEKQLDLDREICTKDIPEYIQEHFGEDRVPCTSTEELTEEASWIYQRAFEMDDRFDQFQKEEIIKKISALLSFVHIEQFDIPFIAIYRREYLSPELLKVLESSSIQQRQDDWKYIWRVLDWDVQWYRFKTRKLKLQDELAIVSENLSEEEKKLSEAIKESLHFTQDEEDLADIEAGLRLCYIWNSLNSSTEEEKKSQRVTARPKQRDKYTTICKRGWKEFLNHFVLTPFQLAENVSTMYQKYVQLSLNKTPSELATEWLTSRNENIDILDNFLDSCRFLFIRELSVDPRFRSTVHSFLRKEALLTSKPTLKAISDLDDFDRLKPCCSIYQKPIQRLLKPSSEFSIVAYCRKLGYTLIEIEVDRKALRDFIEELKTLGRSEGLSRYSTEWNQEIETIIEESVRRVISEQCRELELCLEKRSNLFLREEFRQEAETILSLGPISKYIGLNSKSRIISFFLSDIFSKQVVQGELKSQEVANFNKYVAVGANLSKEGEVEEVCTFSIGVSHGGQINIAENSKEKLIHFLVRGRPDYITIGVGKSKHATSGLKQQLANVWSQILKVDEVSDSEQNASEQQDKLSSCLSKIFLVSEAVPMVYASLRSEEQKEQSYARRMAIAIGRFAQEPLVVYAAIACDISSTSSLEVHPFQNILNASEREFVFRQAMIFATCCYTGVDINRIIIYDHLRPLLNHIGGLGPKKAVVILERLKELYHIHGGKALLSRKEIIANQILDKRVFFSAAGFVRLVDPFGDKGKDSRGKQRNRAKGQRKNELAVNPLENSRVHPENYGIAMKIAEEALRGESEEQEHSDSDIVKVISEVMKRPHLLEELDLEAYADHLEKLGRGKMHDTLRIICEEFENPYRDWRKIPSPLTSKDLFYIITGCTPDRLRCGASVVATNCRPNAAGTGIVCQVEGEIRGYIHRNEIFDEQVSSNFDLGEYLNQTSTLPCRVLSVNYEKFELKLSCRPSVLRNPKKIPEYKEPEFKADPFFLDFSSNFDPLQPDKQPMTADDVQRERSRRMETRRKASLATSSHPLFRNVSGSKAIQLLDQTSPGEIIIRPSSHSPDVVVLSFKVADGLPVVHLEVLEQQQTYRGRETSLYYIGQEKFEALDEVIGRYAEPVLANLQEALQHRKFIVGDEETLEQNCKQQKMTEPQKVAYCIGMSFRYPGRLVIAYLPGRSHVIREIITVLPQGYRFRKLIHADMNSLIDWFKDNFKTLLARPPETARLQ
ncbi:Transcription elongation factor SPT6 [Galdieria sulphuraria]|nr:Transcription elongation factor SPT6 [Galdieria sulphuraria]